MLERFLKLGKDSVVYGIGTVLAKLVNFLLIPIYTRVFFASEYGALDILLLTTTIIMTLGNMGLSASLTLFYFKAKDKQEQKTVVSSNFIFSMAITVLIVILVILFAEELSFALLKNTNYSNYIIITALTIPFIVALNFSATIYRLSFKPFHFFYITLGHAVLSALISIYLVVLKGMGIKGALFGILISAVFFTLLSLYLTRNKFNWRLSKKKLKEMIKLSFPLAPVGIGIWIMDFSGRYFLVQFHNLSQVGLYGVGYKLAGALSLIVSAFRLANVPHQFEMSNDPEAKKFYSKTILYYFFFMLFLAVGLSVFAREVVHIFVGENYFASYKIIPALVFSFLFLGLYHIASLGLILTKKSYYYTFGVLIAAFLTVFLSLLLVPTYGFIGAAVANAVSYFVGFILLFYWSQKHYRIEIEKSRILKVFVLSLILISLGFFIHIDNLLIRIPFKLIILALFLLGSYFILGKKHIKELKVVLNVFKSWLKPLFKSS